MIRFAAIGLDHRHIYGQVKCLLDAGAECVGFHQPTDIHPLAGFVERFPQVPRVESRERLLEDPSIQLIVTAGIPAERAELAVAAMRHGKDVMVDKPGVTTKAQLAEVRKVQKETGRIFSICFSERFEVPAVTKALALVREGRIGKVVQTLGMGPHRLNLPTRPDWFFEREKYGGILCDIASHQIDQFLMFTGAKNPTVTSAQVGNLAHPEHPGLEDFGEMMMRGDGVSGYVRVDWFTPDGLPTWGDGRLTVLGTEGYIEMRKYVDIAGRPGTDHLFLVDHKGMEHFDCSKERLSYGADLLHDIEHRTETAMPQEHCFKVCELALDAQEKAVRL